MIILSLSRRQRNTWANLSIVSRPGDCDMAKIINEFKPSEGWDHGNMED